MFGGQSWKLSRSIETTKGTGEIEMAGLRISTDENDAAHTIGERGNVFCMLPGSRWIRERVSESVSPRVACESFEWDLCAASLARRATRPLHVLAPHAISSMPHGRCVRE